ncbi:DNA-directed DNA polymerase II small subunit [Candidatus Woesearchaeota archaeon]|nr:DNA-directed DNA polymerase II small subunit [Candidatus Woesearchaeota archaeon]
MESVERKKEIVRGLLERGFLVSAEILDAIDDGIDVESLAKEHGNLLVLQKEKPVTEEPATEAPRTKQTSLRIVDDYEDEPEKRDVGNFVDHFSVRFKIIERMLKNRQELVNLISISRARRKREKETLSVIGMVTEKEFTKAKNLILNIEDATGTIKVLVSKNKPELFSAAKDIVLDEVIGIVGVNGENIIFANEVVWPDIPLTKELKKSPKEGYAIFLSDIHVGSKNFLEKEFQKFTKWISGKAGNDNQRGIASKVEYIFIVGDVVDGCGIYPGQENDLETKNITEQYQKAAELLSEIPRHIPIVICAGNHDAVRLSEPQPRLAEDFSAALYKLPNVVMTSNPSTVNIHSDGEFPGFDILLYHGYSFDYYIANVDSIRNNGGYSRADLVMKFLLKRRHLAPTHTSSLYIPHARKDPLAIEKIPDFFVTGHLHKPVVAQYRNITLISGSCWQSTTSFQEKHGLVPEPSRVPIVNLQTREVKILRFGE